jgi:hypothetical protein
MSAQPPHNRRDVCRANARDGAVPTIQALHRNSVGTAQQRLCPPYPSIALSLSQSATARPIAGLESSWMKCEPGTVTSAWFFQLRQNSRRTPVGMAPGSAWTNSFATSDQPFAAM